MKGIRLAFDAVRNRLSRNASDFTVAAADARSGDDPPKDPAHQLLAWCVRRVGIRGGLVTRSGGSVRSESSDLTEVERAVLPWIVMHGDAFLRKTQGQRTPYGIEVDDTSGRKWVAVRLKGGHLCAIAEPGFEISDLIEGVKTWKPVQKRA